MSETGAKILSFPRSARVARLGESDPKDDEKSVPEQLALLLDQLREQFPPRRQSLKTFKDLADAFIEANSSRLVSPYNERRHVFHMKSLWALREDELTVRVVRAMLSKLKKPKGLLGPSTLNKVRSTGKRIIAEAQESGEWTSINPFQIVKRVKEQRANYSNVPKLDEIEKTLPYLREDKRRLTKCAFLCGLRPGELVGMRKVDVDLRRRVVLVRRSHERNTTKTDRWREIPIPTSALVEFEWALAHSPGIYVFPDKKGQRIPRNTKFSRMFRTAMGKAGVGVIAFNVSCRRRGCGYKRLQGPTKGEALNCPKCNYKLWFQPKVRPVRFYDLRHSAATIYRKAGADPLAIKIALGHAATDPTDDIYTHLDEDFMRTEFGDRLTLQEKPRGEETPGAGFTTERRKGLEPSTLSLGSSEPGTQPTDTVQTPNLVLLTLQDVARALQCAADDVEQLVKRGEIKAVRVGTLLRFEQSSLQLFIAKGGSGR